jgi:O-antigen/teichoic acid export membrane protein
VADIAAKGSNGILALLVARFLGPVLYGAFATAAAISELALLATGLGFEEELTRRGGRDSRTLPDALRLAFRAIGATAALAAVGLAVVLAVVPYPPQVLRLVVLMALAGTVARFHLPFRYLGLLRGDSRRTALMQGISTVALVALTLPILVTHRRVEWIVVVQLLVGAAVLAAWLRWLPGELRAAGAVAAGALRRFVRDAAPFAMSNLLWVAYFNFDTFLLSLFRSEREVGLYAGVYRIVGISYVLGNALANSFLPQLFEAHARDPESHRPLARRLLVTMGALGLPLGAVLYAGAGVLVPLVIGSAYADAVAVARVLSVAVFFRCLNFGFAGALMTAERQRTRVLLEVLLLAVNVGVNLALIPRLGAAGAALATVAGELALTVGAVAVCWRGGPLSRPAPRPDTQPVTVTS